jgi:hypothetical protein
MEKDSLIRRKKQNEKVCSYFYQSQTVGKTSQEMGQKEWLTSPLVLISKRNAVMKFNDPSDKYEDNSEIPSDILWIFEQGNLCNHITNLICPKRLKALIIHLEFEGKLYQYKTENLFRKE